MRSLRQNVLINRGDEETPTRPHRGKTIRVFIRKFPVADYINLINSNFTDNVLKNNIPLQTTLDILKYEN